MEMMQEIAADAFEKIGAAHLGLTHQSIQRCIRRIPLITLFY